MFAQTKVRERLEALIKRTPFSYADVIEEGQQVTVLNNRSLPFVVKIPRTAELQLSVTEGYNMCAPVIGDLVAPYTILPIIEFNINGRKSLTTNVIVQKRVEDLLETFPMLSSAQQETVIQRQVQIDHAMLSRGICIPDTYNKNFGLIDEMPLVHDLGLTVDNPRSANVRDYCTTEYDFGLNGTDSYFLERGFCIHNRYFEYGLDDKTGRGQAVFREAIGVDLIKDYHFGVSAQDIVKNKAFSESLLFKICKIHPQGEIIRKSYLQRPNREESLCLLAVNVREFGEELLNGLQRLQHKDEFIAAGKAEFDKHYETKKGEAVPVLFSI